MHLDWWLGLAGGLLIGAAASLLWLLYCRILGVSGVVAGLWQQTGGERAWRVWFVAGVLLSGLIYRLSFGLPEISLSYPWWWLALAGFLVGVGTRMGMAEAPRRRAAAGVAGVVDAGALAVGRLAAARRQRRCAGAPRPPRLAGCRRMARG